MRLAVVINAHSGSFGGDLTPDIVAERLRVSGCEAVIEPDDGRDLVARVRAAAGRSGIEAVVVGGGDGTILCAAEVLAGTGIALGILPLGTMNMLAKDVGVPVALEEAVAALASGSRRAIDVGEVNGRLFLIQAVIGTPPKIARLRETLRGRMSLGGLLRVVAEGIRLLGRDAPVVAALESGGARRRLRTRALVVVNNDLEEGLGQILARSRLDRGCLTVYAADDLNAARALRLGLGMALGSWRQAPGLMRLETCAMTLRTTRRRLRVMLDGELTFLDQPLRFRIRPGALQVIVPARETVADALAREADAA